MTTDSLSMLDVLLPGIGLLAQQTGVTSSQVIEMLTSAGLGGIVLFLLVWFIPDIIKRHDQAEEKARNAFREELTNIQTSFADEQSQDRTLFRETTKEFLVALSDIRAELEGLKAKSDCVDE